MFEVSEQLESQVQKQFNNEIKSKRIKKQLHFLKQNPPDDIAMQPLIFTNVGVSIPFTYTTTKPYKFQLRLDKQYPFNQPQIHSLDTLDYFAEARDLLGQHLDKINVQWGPSKMLRDLLAMVPDIVKSIEQNEGKLMGKYYTEEMYSVQQLKRKGMQIFKVNRITQKRWGNKKKPMILAISRNYALLLTDEDEKQNSIILKQLFKIVDILRVFADLKTLNVDFCTEGPFKTDLHHLIEMGNEQQLTTILSLLNPNQMIEKQIVEIEKSGKKTQQLVTLYTKIIEHYSIRDNYKYNLYMKKMKEAIQQVYK